MTEPRPYQAALQSLDSDFATALRAATEPLGDAIIAAIRASVPEYAQPLEGSFGRGVRAGVSEALTRFAESVERPGEDDPEDWRRVYFNLGRGELRAGRTLESLLAAYRVGARVAWRGVAEAAANAGAGPAELTALAEAIFAYIDELSAISAEGYAAEQATTAGEAQRRRERLVRLLIEGSASPEAIAQAARDAGWAPPPSVAALVVRDERPAAIATRLGAATIARPLGDGLTCAIVADPLGPGRHSQIAAALGDRVAAIGPASDPSGLPRSFRRARATLELLESGRIEKKPAPARADEHLAALALHADPELVAEHAERELAPLGALPPSARARLLETLEAWLDHPGRPTEVARAVHIHPQTARYRLRALREHLGDIDDPERRFALSLAVRGTGARSA